MTKPATVRACLYWKARAIAAENKLAARAHKPGKLATRRRLVPRYTTPIPRPCKCGARGLVGALMCCTSCGRYNGSTCFCGARRRGFCSRCKTLAKPGRVFCLEFARWQENAARYLIRKNFNERPERSDSCFHGACADCYGCGCTCHDFRRASFQWFKRGRVRAMLRKLMGMRESQGLAPIYTFTRFTFP